MSREKDHNRWRKRKCSGHVHYTHKYTTNTYKGLYVTSSCKMLINRLVDKRPYTVFEYNEIGPFHQECCGPNGPSINTLMTLFPRMLPTDYLNGYLLSNHLQCMCQFLALPQSSGLLVLLSISLEVIIHHVIVLGLPFSRTRSHIILASNPTSSGKILLIPSSS